MSTKVVPQRGDCTGCQQKKGRVHICLRGHKFCHPCELEQLRAGRCSRCDRDMELYVPLGIALLSGELLLAPVIFLLFYYRFRWVSVAGVVAVLMALNDEEPFFPHQLLVGIIVYFAFKRYM